MNTKCSDTVINENAAVIFVTLNAFEYLSKISTYIYSTYVSYFRIYYIWGNN